MCISFSFSWTSWWSISGLAALRCVVARCLSAISQRVVAHAERVRGELEIAEHVAARVAARLAAPPFTSPTTFACGTRAFSKISSAFW